MTKTETMVLCYTSEEATKFRDIDNELEGSIFRCYSRVGMTTTEMSQRPLCCCSESYSLRLTPSWLSLLCTHEFVPMYQLRDSSLHCCNGARYVALWRFDACQAEKIARNSKSQDHEIFVLLLRRIYLERLDTMTFRQPAVFALKSLHHSS